MKIESFINVKVNIFSFSEFLNQHLKKNFSYTFLTAIKNIYP